MQNGDFFSEKLERGGIPLVTIISFNDPTVTEAVCRDLDFVWIDSEHSAMSLPIIQGHVMATKGSRAAAHRAGVYVAMGDDVGLMLTTLNQVSDEVQAFVQTMEVR